jgi:hypothetical protein
VLANSRARLGAGRAANTAAVVAVLTLAIAGVSSAVRQYI